MKLAGAIEMNEYHLLLLAIWVTTVFIAFKVNSIDEMLTIMFENQHDKPPWYRG